MAVIGVNLLTNRQCCCTTPFAASSQILWTNETGSTGARVLKNITVPVRNDSCQRDIDSQLTTCSVNLGRLEKRFCKWLPDTLDFLLDGALDIAAIVGVLVLNGTTSLVCSVQLERVLCTCQRQKHYY